MTIHITDVRPGDGGLVIAFDIIGQGGREHDDTGVVYYYGTLPVSSEITPDVALTLLRDVHTQLYEQHYAAFALKQKLAWLLTEDGKLP